MESIVTENNNIIMGLTQDEAAKLKQQWGDNVLPSKENFSWFGIFAGQFKSPLVYILLIAAGISLFFGEYTDVALILMVVSINALMSFYQEYSAQKTLKALNQIISPKIIALRDGQRQEIEVKNLVPGDVVVLGGGDKVPSDGVIIEGDILVSEIILTGESEAVEKAASQQSPIYMGTLVLSGIGLMKVEKIGLTTKIGAISQSLQDIKEVKTPLQEKLETFSKYLAVIIAVVCLMIFVTGVLSGHYQGIEMLKIAIILSVAAIPEGLPIATTVIMTLGMRRILKKHGLVKKLLSIETLGSATVICADKTGTLTEGAMKVVKTDFNESEKAHWVLIFNNNQRSNLEIALWQYAAKQIPQASTLFQQVQRIFHEPFDSQKKYSSTLIKMNGQTVKLLMGAPDIIINFCSLNESEKQNINGKIESWSREGLRLLGLAMKADGDLQEKTQMQWLGLVGLEDPLRPNAHQALMEAKKAGLGFKLITGDYRATAEKIAQKLDVGIKPENIMEGAELETLSMEQLKNRIGEISLFCRTTPLQKLKIIQALQEKGEIVAMTGDGVNDAPALKKADIGVVMANGAEVAKTAGDLILLDNNFHTIVSAIEEGRLVFSNIKKVVGYVLSNSFAEIILIFGSIVFGLPTPLTIIQILWIHLICDGPPDIMLGFENKERDILAQRPEAIGKEEILSGPIKFLILAISSVVGLSALWLFNYYYQNHDLTYGRSIAFATIASVSLVYIFSFKSFQQPLWHKGILFSNKYLWLSVVYGFTLIFLALYVPFFNKILGIEPLGFLDWLKVLSVGLASLLIVETVKKISLKK